MLGYLFVNTAEQVWIIYTLAFLESAVSQFFRPSVLAVVPTLVKGEEEFHARNAALWLVVGNRPVCLVLHLVECWSPSMVHTPRRSLIREHILFRSLLVVMIEHSQAHAGGH